MAKLREQVFYQRAADRLVPRGCSCPDDSGSCEWCEIYYKGPPAEMDDDTEFDLLRDKELL